MEYLSVFIDFTSHDTFDSLFHFWFIVLSVNYYSLKHYSRWGCIPALLHDGLTSTHVLKSYFSFLQPHYDKVISRTPGELSLILCFWKLPYCEYSITALFEGDSVSQHFSLCIQFQDQSLPVPCGSMESLIFIVVHLR